MSAPQTQFGWSSNCIFCEDHALDHIAHEFGILLLAISAISFAAGFLAHKKETLLPLLVMLAVVQIFLIEYKINWLQDVNLRLHAMVSHVGDFSGPRPNIQRLMAGAMAFHREASLKGWGIFSALPFLIGMALGLLRRRSGTVPA